MTTVGTIIGKSFEITDKDDGKVYRFTKQHCGFWDYKIIEPEKSNQELAKELVRIWHSSSMSLEKAFKFIFDVMDQKIKGSK